MGTAKREYIVIAVLLTVAAGCANDVVSDGEESAPEECPELVWQGPGDSFIETLEVRSPADVESIPLYTRVEGNLVVEGVEGQVDLDFLRCIRQVTGGGRIKDNPDLVSLTGLEALVEIGGEDPSYNFVAVLDNDSLQNVEGLMSIESIGALSVERNASLTSLEGLGSLRSVDLITIGDNDSLSVIGLRSLESVGELYIGGLECPSDPSSPW